MSPAVSKNDGGGVGGLKRSECKIIEQEVGNECSRQGMLEVRGQ